MHREEGAVGGCAPPPKPPPQAPTPTTPPRTPPPHLQHASVNDGLQAFHDAWQADDAQQAVHLEHVEHLAHAHHAQQLKGCAAQQQDG